MSSLVSVELLLLGSAVTTKSLAFQDPESEVRSEPIWIPRSQINNLDDVLDAIAGGIDYGTREKVEIHIPTWLAEKKGLDPYAEELEERP